MIRRRILETLRRPRAVATTAIELAGFGFLVLGAWSIVPWLGELVAGVALLAVALAIEGWRR
ncbi:MAG TPA: hypothetical protein VEN82_07215 [Actinomycetota bacterium]|nr:hypothetical protein [Actinomycetota bacterium]